MIVIMIMIEKSIPKGHRLKNGIARIKQEANSFDKIPYFHIKQDLNEEVNHWEKQASSLKLGSL